MKQAADEDFDMEYFEVRLTVEVEPPTDEQLARKVLLEVSLHNQLSEESLSTISTSADPESGNNLVIYILF